MPRRVSRHNVYLNDSSQSQMKPIHTRGSLTVAEVLSAARLAPPLGNKIAMWIMRGLLGVALFYAHGFAIYMLYQEGFSGARFALAIALFVDVVIAFPIVHLWRSHRELSRLHRERQGAFVETEGRIDEEGLFVRSENFKGSVRWHQYCGYRANEMVIVLYENYPSRYAILGRSKFASGVDWLRSVALVSEKLPRL